MRSSIALAAAGAALLGASAASGAAQAKAPQASNGPLLTCTATGWLVTSPRLALTDPVSGKR